jgi:hypothetical protein
VQKKVEDMPIRDAWKYIRAMEGETLHTLRRGKPFTVIAVHEDRVRVFPQDGKGSERSVPRDQIEYVANLELRQSEMRQAALQQYPKSQNTSYIAAIAFEANRRAHNGPSDQPRRA